ncbi:MAG TPA: CocE/NonD family hydrolase [Kiloniellales bacterium]
MSDTDLNERIVEIENLWIPMPDGCRIAARIWLPDMAVTTPVPAVLEYIPYRKRDFMRARDEPIHRYFANHGYAAVRVDIRGSGDSDGVLYDEYTQQEMDDAVAIIAWIAEQDWCSGAVGMMGISWGGFNSMQVAALRPPALKAIITLCSTDDRYADDAHYMGGCLLNENMQWGSILMTYGALPPDPVIVGARWRDMWRQRIDRLVPFPAVWMQHQTRDDYWKHGSVCEDLAAIECAVYAIGGWADGYSNAVPRLLNGLRCPKKGLIGPWAHVFPHDGVPGPAIGFLQEAVRWWDHWLRGAATGIMDEPAYRVWMQESIPPRPQYDERPGRWVAEAAWPSPRIQPHRLHLSPGRLERRRGPVKDMSIASPQTTGAVAGEWCAFGADGEMPVDQRPDDGRSLTFDGEPLNDRLEILGAPVLTLDIAADKPNAIVAVRLNDVAPDGTSAEVTYGLLNLTHRGGHETPLPLEPGAFYRVKVQVNDIAYAFPKGHRVRVAISTSYWPIAWPSPEISIITVRCGVSTLELPVRPPRQEDAALRPFEEPESAPTTEHKKLRQLPLRRVVEFDLTNSEATYTVHSDGGEFDGASLARIETIGMDLGYSLLRRHRISDTDPLSAQTEFEQRAIMRRADWSVRIESRTRLTATRDTFQFSADVEAFEGDDTFAKRKWQLTIPRNMV